MSLSEELRENGIDPDAPNDSGYECGKCSRIPTNWELHSGTCYGCNPALRPSKNKALETSGEDL